MEKGGWLRKIIYQIERNRDSIYFFGNILMLLLSIVAGIWAFTEFPDWNPDKVNSSIVAYIFNPLVLGLSNFLIVFFIGSLIVATVSMTYTRRMKAFNVEVEFETMEYNEITVGQAHYLSSILKNHDKLIGHFIKQEEVSYQDVLNVICFHYRQYFTESFDRNLVFKVRRLKNMSATRTERLLLRFIENNNMDVGFQNRLIGNRTILMGKATTIVPGEEELIVTFYSDGAYEFDEYDVEAVRVLLTYSDIALQHLTFIKYYE